MNRPIVRLIDLGQMHYRPALELQVYADDLGSLTGKKSIHFHIFQESLVQKIKSGCQDHFLLSVEHYPVYTVGIRRKEYGPEQVEKLKKLGADFVPTNRGGLITFHGPGSSVFNDFSSSSSLNLIFVSSRPNGSLPYFKPQQICIPRLQIQECSREIGHGNEVVCKYPRANCHRLAQGRLWNCI